MIRARRSTLLLVGAAIALGPSIALARQAADPAAAAVAPGAPAAGGSETFLMWMARASGPIGIVILAMSFYLVAVMVWMAMEFRRSIAIPDATVREVGELLERKKYTEAFQRLTLDPSYLSKVLAAGVRKLPSGQVAAQRAMELANDDAAMAMEHRTTYLSTVGTLGPMIGLIGTVYGMIQSFRVIATSGGSPQASALAGGISTALFATLEGIAISVPAIAGYAFFRNRIARISLEVAMMAESLLESFAPGVRSVHPLAATARAASVATPPAAPKGE